MRTLETVLCQGCRVLVLSGHCNGPHMFFEGEKTGLDRIGLKQLRDLLEKCKRSNQGQLSVDVVVLSMCMSESFGQVFEEMGVPHVICIDRQHAVRS